jgi:hypothetical protein
VVSEHIHVAMMNLLWPRRGLSRQIFFDYWSGAHTQISSRLPGIHQYFQHHLDHAAGESFPASGSFPRASTENPGFFGDAEITFASAVDLAAFAGALDPLMADEQNVFDKTISYQALGENVRTAVDLQEDDSPNGELGQCEKFMLYARRRTDVSLTEFRARIRDSLLDVLVESGHVVKARVRLVEHYDNAAVTLSAPNVDNDEPNESQIDAAIEVVFSNASARRGWGEIPAASTVAQILQEAARDVFACRVLRTFTVYNHGQITTAGLRTPHMAAQIAAIGAINQSSAQTMALLLGEHVQADHCLLLQ